MKDNKQIAEEFISKYNQGTATPAERMLVEQWFLLDLEKNDAVPDTERINLADERISANLAKHINRTQNGKTIRLWPRIAAVAAAVALIVLGVYFFNYRSSVILNSVQDPALAMNDIAPGKNGATIILANGKVIQLSDAKSGVVIGEDKLAYNDGSPLSPQGGSLPEGESSAVAKTAKGQTYIFTLPDGTKVWLNAASSLTIPSGFSGTESRIVELSGEAYFEVAKNKKRPFIVKTAGNNGQPGQEVTVLGTHFNVSAYKDEGSVKTTLLEGSVLVRHAEFILPGAASSRSASRNRKTALQGRDPDLRQDDERVKHGTEGSVILKPNQQSVVTGNNRIQVKDVDPAESVSWKEGKFSFNREEIGTIMKRVARWYDIEAVYQNGADRVKFSGAISRYENISGIIKMLESTGELKFKVEGRKVYVQK